jgi:hypothetical protein
MGIASNILEDVSVAIKTDKRHLDFLMDDKIHQSNSPFALKHEAYMYFSIPDGSMWKMKVTLVETCEYESVG